MIEQNKIAEALREHRVSNSISLDKVALATGISKSTLSRAERSIGTLDADSLVVLGRFLNVPIDGDGAVVAHPTKTIDAICDIIRADPKLGEKEADGLCSLMKVAYKEMVGLEKSRR